ncbi:lantibiotic dehydratase family protein [Flavobacterium sp. CHNK8]|uniref:lantibiotic dehydratase family protein n=1 Tax=Flavobacterium sp. CHNK8 TaxID=2871165 RepID=UPI001C8ED300|nr:lantibiotic dehydratase family protein [Flavobacterium sp. CHNK8]QZK88978.1 lantibiotic dehydratase family protein [Flavobacterium sp. CHNK8]
MHHYQIRPFSSHVLRTPLLPLSFYTKIMEKEAVISVFDLLQDPLVYEALQLASPELVVLVEKYWKNPQSFSNKKTTALAFSVLKYCARMASRCTPFGLFAGCTVGEKGQTTNIVMDHKELFQRHTQLDMQFWIALLQELAKQEEVRNTLNYKPNTSLYEVGSFYRYVEYRYKGTKREHSIAALRKTDVLILVYEKSKQGITIEALIDLLADDASERDDAKDFVNQLIDFQFLVSDLDGAVTTKNEWDRIQVLLERVPNFEKEITFFKTLKDQIESLDAGLVPKPNAYTDIKDILTAAKVTFDEKYLFQTDLTTATSVNTMHPKVYRQTLEALTFLNGIQKKHKKHTLEEFIKAFLHRYEGREMPLALVLDTEIGLGYPVSLQRNDTHELLEFIYFKNKNETETQTWSAFDRILEQKLQTCKQLQQTVLELTEKDFTDFDCNWKEAPTTFSVLIELLKEDVVVLESSGNVSAVKLLGRFCNGNEAIATLTAEIVAKEQAYDSNQIKAEVVHIPESRTGNILKRPPLRLYEIPYLSHSGVSEAYQIGIDDLMVSVQNNTIILRSKKHNKTVVPCLSNAHNYASKSLPSYHFLCDLQGQNDKPIYSFDWGVLFSHYHYFPRVVYKKVILSKAKWVVTADEISFLAQQAENVFFEVFTNWRKERQLPQWVNWIQFDNTLLLNFDKELGARLLINAVKKQPKIILEEFLFMENSAVNDAAQEMYSNQIILSFYKEKVT